MYQVGSHGIGYYWGDTNWGMIYTQQLSQCEMIASLIAPNIGQESRGYVVGIWRGHTKSIITWNCIHFIAKVDGWLQSTYGMIPPNLVYTTIFTYHNTLTAAGYEQSTEYNIVYMHSTYMLFWCKHLKVIYILHLLLCCPKIGICAHHMYIYKLKVVSKRMNIVLHSIIGYTIVVSIANFDCFAAV